MTRLEVVERLTNDHGKSLVILPWWREAFAALDDPAMRELILWLVRQVGKSTLAAAMLISTLLTKRGSYSAGIAAGQAQAESIYHRKVRRPFERLARELSIPKKDLIITRRSIEVLSLESKIEILATDEGTVPGRSITEGGVLVLDEARDIPDSVYAALAPSAIGGGGKIVLASTAGAPRGFFYDACMNPTPETWLYHARTNDNPFASKPMLDFLARRLGVLVPSAKRRELDNEFTEDAESFLPAALIDAAIDDALGELPSSPLPAFAFYHLSRKRDLTSRVVVVRESAQRPEAQDHLQVVSVRTWDPRQSPTKEVDFAEVRTDLDGLPVRFPRLEAVLIDEGAEAGSLLPFAKATAALTLKVRGFVASPESNANLWGALAARLHSRTLSIPRHERLIAELRGLRQETFSFGSKWRVVDSSRRLHRDLSLALAGAVYAAGEAGPPAIGGTLESLATPAERAQMAAQESGAGFWGTRPQRPARESDDDEKWQRALEQLHGQSRGRGSIRPWH